PGSGQPGSVCASVRQKSRLPCSTTVWQPRGTAARRRDETTAPRGDETSTSTPSRLRRLVFCSLVRKGKRAPRRPIRQSPRPHRVSDQSRPEWLKSKKKSRKLII